MALEGICKALGARLRPVLCDEAGHLAAGRVVAAAAVSAGMSVVALTLAMPDSLNLGPEATIALREVRPIAVVMASVFALLAAGVALGAAGVQLYFAPTPGRAERTGPGRTSGGGA